MNSSLVSGTKMAFNDALLTAVLGYATVFAGILLLIIVVMIVGRLMSGAKNKAAAKNGQTAGKDSFAAGKGLPEGSAVTEEKRLAPGSAGELKLYDTDPKTAAMIMAIVADNLGKPLGELRFRSIREVKEDEI